MCRVLELARARAEPALEAYRVYAEGRYGISRSMERLSSTLAPRPSVDPCLALEGIQAGVNRGVCILGPSTPPSLDGCPALAGPEPAVYHALARGRRLLYLTTDLDMSFRLLGMAEYGSRYKLVHVHGDNHYRLSLAQGWSGVLYTSQVDNPYTLPLGGFTDGDRAVVIALILGAPWVRVLGFHGGVKAWYKDYGLQKEGKVEVALRIIEHVAAGLGYRVEWRRWGLELISPRLHDGMGTQH
ncbi:MAG: hypothetical protein F7B18_07650 [Desulfurococcales archaeon]|nr:hypothetical protein [Desulfurococcales archaeon]